MSEEERLIISFLYFSKDLNISEVKLKKEDIITIINLIEKLQKDLEDEKKLSKKRWKNLKRLREEIEQDRIFYLSWHFQTQKENYISKSKIRREIKKIEEEQKRYEELPNSLKFNEDIYVYKNVSKILKELLGDEVADE